MTVSPLVSCLCVSNNRPQHLKKAVTCFFAQTYQNKELIVVSRDYDPCYASILADFPNDSLRYLTLDANLGQLRSFAIEQSRGEYFCVWDDDDWYHYRRIELQLEAAIKNKKDGSNLPFYILYNAVEKQAYMSKPLPPTASVLCKRSLNDSDLLYLPLDKAEDTMILPKLNQLNALYPLIDAVLYVYIYHGKNTWPMEHFHWFCGRRFSEDTQALIADVVTNKYSCEHGSELLNNSAILKEFDYYHYQRS